jgi:predicted nucleic acid-binding protein
MDDALLAFLDRREPARKSKDHPELKKGAAAGSPKCGEKRNKRGGRGSDDGPARHQRAHRHPKSPRSEFFRQLLQEGHTFACCAITIAEVYAAMRPHEKSATEELLGGLEYFETPRRAAEHAGHLKAVWARKGHTLGLPNALVAAVALVNGLALATDNRRHFPMPELKLLPLPALH